MDNLYIALIHYPVENRKKEKISSAVTTIDIHDIARAGLTYGIKGFYIVTPFDDQIILAKQVIKHWTKGIGGHLNPFRRKALELVKIENTFDNVVLDIKKQNNLPLISIATSAKYYEKSISTRELIEKNNDKCSFIIIFGTAWGIAEDFVKQCDFILQPIKGKTDYNHLSVRSAVSIYLDRLFLTYEKM